MPWLIALAAGILCALVGAAFSLALADVIVRAYRIPSFEGASGYFVFFVLLPLGAIAGFVTGFALLKAGGPGYTLVRFLLAPLATIGLVTIGYGISYLTVDRPPRAGGHTMNLELEVRLPESAPIPVDFRDSKPRISLYASDKDNRFVTIDYAARYPEARAQLAAWVAEGNLRFHEEVVSGLENAPAHFLRLFDGTHRGKLMVKLSDPKGS